MSVSFFKVKVSLSKTLKFIGTWDIIKSMNCNVVLRAWCNNFFLFFIFYFLCLCLYFGCDLRPVKTLWTRVHHPTCPVEISTRHKSCPFISLFNCLFCLPICDFYLSIYMYMCVYTHTKWKTYLEFHNDFFFGCTSPQY